MTLPVKKRSAAKRTDISVLETAPETGLSAEEAAARAEAGWSNLPVEPPTRTVGQIIRSNVFTYFNAIFVLLAAAMIAVHSQITNILFMGVVVINAAIGIVQELRSKKALDELNILSSPKAAVIRGGELTETTVDRLVRDDVVVFSAGDQVCADALVLTGECLVNEALVTGEADEIKKTPGSELLSGSFLVSGECRARLTAVGEDSFVNRLTLEAKRQKKPKLRGMMRSLSDLVKWIGIVILPMGALLIVKEVRWLGRDLTAGVTSTVGALVGMIPEGLYLLTSLALVAGVMRLARKKTMCRQLDCIETLARVDTLCVDKTGTVTENKMVVEDIVLLCPDRFVADDVRMIMADYVHAMQSDNDTMAALRKYFTGSVNQTAIDALPFTSARKYGGVSFHEDETYLLGAPDVLLGEGVSMYSEVIDRYSSRGCRVLLLTLYDGRLSDEELTAEKLPIALVLLSNKIRAEAPETFSYFASQGVSVRVISGPDQKRRLVIALKQQGHTVAMTGDGVNDVLALKEADCSVAMASGSEVACQVSQLVLMESDFSAMPSVVAEGRRVINNIERSAALYLVKNIFSISLALLSLLFTLPYPLAPAQLGLVNSFTIGIPSFVLAMEPNRSRVQGRFLVNVLLRALPAALTDLFLTEGVMLFYLAAKIPDGAVSTICTGVMGVVGMMMVFRTAQPMNRMHIAMIAGLSLSMVGCFFFLKPVFNLVPLDFLSHLVLGVFSLLAWPTFRVMELLVAKARLGGVWLRDKFRELRAIEED